MDGPDLPDGDWTSRWPVEHVAPDWVRLRDLPAHERDLAVGLGCGLSCLGQLTVAVSAFLLAGFVFLGLHPVAVGVGLVLLVAMAGLAVEMATTKVVTRVGIRPRTALLIVLTGWLATGAACGPRSSSRTTRARRPRGR